MKKFIFTLLLIVALITPQSQALIALSRNGVYLAFYKDDTMLENIADRKQLHWDSLHYLANDQDLKVGDLFVVSHLEYAPDPLQNIIAEVTVSPGTNGSVSNSGIPGAPNNVAGSTLTVYAVLKIGETILPVSETWTLSLKNASKTEELKVRVSFSNGVASFNYPTEGKPGGTYYLDDADFAKIELSQNMLDALGVSGEPGYWQTVLIAPVVVDIYEQLQ